MPYKDSQKAKEESVKRMQEMRKRRNKDDVTPVTPLDVGVTKRGVTPDRNVTPSMLHPVTPGIREKYPHVVHLLADSVKREKFRRICGALSERGDKYLDIVFLAKSGTTMRTVSELLEAF